jgi:hypothetical protein
VLAAATDLLQLAASPLSTITGLKLLANSIRRLSQLSARLLYKTVVLPVLTYGSPYGSQGGEAAQEARWV